MNTARILGINSLACALLLGVLILLDQENHVTTSGAFIAFMSLATVCLALWSFAERYTAGLNGIRSDLKSILEAIPNLAQPSPQPILSEEETLRQKPCSKCGGGPQFVGNATIQCTRCDNIEVRPKIPTLDVVTELMA